MAKDKRLQKVFYFSSDKNKKIIESFLADESETSRLSITRHLENHLLESILTTNNTAANWISRLYLTENETVKEAIRNVMSDIFNYYSMVKRNTNNNGRMFVEYAKQINDKVKRTEPEELDKDTLVYFRIQLQAYKILLENKYATLPSQSEILFNAGNDVEVISLIIDRFSKDEISNIQGTSTMLYQLVLKNWDDTKDYSGIFQMMSSMSKLQTWDDTAEARIMLSNVIRSSVDGQIC